MSVKDQRALKRKKLLELLDAVFDPPDQLADDELGELHREIKPDEDPKDWLRAASAKAAQSYRLRGEKVPHHVQAALEATKPSSVEPPTLGGMMKHVDSLLSSGVPPLRLQPAPVSLRKEPDKELSEKDRAILEGLWNEISNEKRHTEEDDS